MDQQNQQQEPKKKSKKTLWIVLGVVAIFIVIGIVASNGNNINQTNITVSAEDQIKEVLKNYYSLNGQRKFGDAYQYIANTSNVSQKDYVDSQSERGLFVTGFNDISYNYIEVKDDITDASVTIVWDQMNNPLVNGDTYNQDSKLQLVKENGDWKILWKKIESE